MTTEERRVEQRQGSSFHGTAHDRRRPDLRGRIKVAAFRRGITDAEMPHDLLSREFPLNPRGTA